MAKKDPAWKIKGLDGPPPAVNGYHDYGVQWTESMGSQREPLWAHLRIAAWSMRYWWTKVIKDIRHGMRENREVRRAERAAERGGHTCFLHCEHCQCRKCLY